MKEEEREYITVDQKGMWMLKKLLDIKSNKCYYCKKQIAKNVKFGIFNKPTRLVCNSYLCLIEAMMEDEKK